MTSDAEPAPQAESEDSPTPSQRLRARGWEVIDDDVLDAEPTVMELTDVEQLRVLNDPTRMRLMASIARRPESAKGLAERFGVPTTRLYHHLGLLEQHGFIEVVATRRSGARTERCYGMRPRSSLRPSPSLADVEDRRELADAVAAVVEMAAASLAEAVVAGRVEFHGDEDAVMVSSSMLRLTEDEQRRFTGELAEIQRRMSAASRANLDARERGETPADEAVQLLVVLAPDVLAPTLPTDLAPGDER